MKTYPITRTLLMALLFLATAGPWVAFSDGQDTTQHVEKRVKALEESLAQMSGVGNVFKTYWKDGVRAESAAGDLKVRMGGRLMLDATWVDEDDEVRDEIGKQDDGADVRRARFYTSGTLYDEVDFKLQFDWATGDTNLKDAYLALRNLPVGYLRVGHFYEPYSLTALISSKYNTFMERPPSVNAFSPVRNMGVMLNDTLCDQAVTWAAGVFREADSQGNTTDEDLYSFTARLTGLLWYAEDGKQLLHVGAAGSYRHLDGMLRYRSRPSINNVDSFVDTRVVTEDPDTGETERTDVDADDAWVVGLEVASVLDAFHIQAELTGARVDVATGDDYEPFGWYVQTGYFLTGEHRPYGKKNGRFTMLHPKRNYGKDGWGAWEVAARYSYVDLSKNGIEGGELDDVTLGINWYLNPAVRVMANYVYADLAGVGDAHLVGTRFQVAF